MKLYVTPLVIILDFAIIDTVAEGNGLNTPGMSGIGGGYFGDDDD